MGRPCREFVEAGYDVTVWNRTPSRADDWWRKGPARSHTARRGNRIRVVFTIVSDLPVGIGPCGRRRRIRGLRSGSVLVDSSTVSPHWSAARGGRSGAGRPNFWKRL